MLKRLHRRQNGETPGISKIPRLKAAQSGVRYRYQRREVPQAKSVPVNFQRVPREARSRRSADRYKSDAHGRLVALCSTQGSAIYTELRLGFEDDVRVVRRHYAKSRPDDREIMKAFRV